MSPGLLRKSLLIVLLASFPACAEREAEQPSLVVFAAASLREVAVKLAEAFTAEHPAHVVFNFAGSNTLAQQILAAPGADVFISADMRWLDQLESMGRLESSTRRAILSNRLVLIARRDAHHAITRPDDLVTASYRFLVLADPQAVPAGRYAKATLVRLSTDGDGSLWDRVAERVIPALDVRAALAMVEAEPESVGIVYRTEALSSRGVKVLFTFPVLDGVPITYGAAVVRDGARPELAQRFVDFLSDPAARTISERYGFEPLASDPEVPAP